MVAPADLRTFLEGVCVLSEVIDDLASNRGLSTVIKFVDGIDSNEEAKDVFFEGGPHVKNLGQMGNVKSAWRAPVEKEGSEHEAETRVRGEVRLVPLGSSQPSSSFVNIPRFFQLREFVFEQTHLALLQRRTRKCPRTRVISFNTDDDAVEERAPQGLLELFQQLRVLCLSWCIVDIDMVEWDGQQTRYSQRCQTEEHISVHKNRALDLQPSYTEQSIVRWVTGTEDDFRVKAVELARTLRGQVPWSLALLRAQKELASKWDQRRDFLYTAQCEPNVEGRRTRPRC